MKLLPQKLYRTLLTGCICCSALVAQAETLATLNGTAITEADLQQFQQNRPEIGKMAKNQQDLLREYINFQLITADAVRRKVDSSDAYQKELASLRTQLLLKHTLQQALEENPVTDSEVEQLYNNNRDKWQTTEYNARHILVAEEPLAKQLISELDKGADFAELAMKHSTGPTGKKGGDLGWFEARSMVPPFAKAVAELANKTYTTTPVQTQFGWHVIYLEDKRTSEPPALADVKPQLEKALHQQHLSIYLTKLVQQAKIEYNEQ